MIEIEEYLDADGNSPFGKWFDELKAQAAAKVATYLAVLRAVTFLRSKVLAKVCMSAGLIRGRDIGSMRAETEKN